MKDLLVKLNECKKIQGEKGNYDYDEYMFGLYNGLELACAIMEEREPIYKNKDEVKKRGIEIESIITNGYINNDTIWSFVEKGFKFVTTIPANVVHPYALDTDKITFFTKYHEYSKEDLVEICDKKDEVKENETN